MSEETPVLKIEESPTVNIRLGERGPTTKEVDIGNFPANYPVTQVTNPWTVSGAVIVSNLNEIHITASGKQEVTQGTKPWEVNGTVGVTQSTSPWVVSGTTSITNLPAIQQVSQATSPWTVSGTVSQQYTKSASTVRQEAKNITPTPATILNANPTRNGLEIENISVSGICYLGLGQTALSSGNMAIFSNGGSWDGRIGNVVWTGSVSAVSTVPLTIAIIEI